MLNPRRARATGIHTTDGWWYINPRSIDIYAEYQGSDFKDTTSVRLTRTQLVRALEIMDAAQTRQEQK